MPSKFIVSYGNSKEYVDILIYDKEYKEWSINKRFLIHECHKRKEAMIPIVVLKHIQHLMNIGYKFSGIVTVD